MSDRFVYFIKPVGAVGPIKIGCSKRPFTRLQQQLSWSPSPLTIICTIPGDLKLEARIQTAFADLHSHAEWFRAEAPLVEAIAELQRGVPVHVAIDLPEDCMAFWQARRVRPVKGAPTHRHAHVRTRGPAEAVVQYDEALRDLGIRIDPILEEASIARSTWSRWKSGSNAPRFETWERLEPLLKQAIEAAA